MRSHSARLWLVALFVASLPAVNVRLYASDEVQYFAFLRSLWFDGDVSFDNEYRYFYDTGVVRFEGFRQTQLERTTATGLRINFGTIGPALLWAPFYAIADAGVIAARAAGAAVERDGYSKPYLAAVCYGSAIYGFAAVLLSARIAWRLLGTGAGAATAIWIGTPLLFYMYLAAGMAHAVSAFSATLLIFVWLRVRDRWTPGGMMALAAVAALVAMVREQDVLFMAGPALDYAVSVVKRLRSGAARFRDDIVGPLAGLAVFAVAYAPQALAYLELNGRIGPSPLVTRKLTWTSPHFFEVLLSPAHGFLWWTPIAALAIAGLVLLVRQRLDAGGALPLRTIGLAMLVSTVAEIYIAGCVESWTVAGAFGQRRFVVLTPVLIVGLAALWRRVSGRLARPILTCAIAVMIWWNLALMALFGAGMMDRQRLELGRNAYDAFVTLPRLAPELAYRYVTRRESFFRPPPGEMP